MKTILRRHKTSDKLRTSYDRAISFDLKWNCPVPVRLFPRPTRSIRHFRVACSFCVKKTTHRKMCSAYRFTFINSFSYERFSTEIRLETEVQGNSEPEIDWPWRNIEAWELGKN